MRIFIGGRRSGKSAMMKARIAELERDNAALHKLLAESEQKVKEPTLFQQLFQTSPAVNYAIKHEIRKKQNLPEAPYLDTKHILDPELKRDVEERLRRNAQKVNHPSLFVSDELACANDPKTCWCRKHAMERTVTWKPGIPLDKQVPDDYYYPRNVIPIHPSVLEHLQFNKEETQDNGPDQPTS